MYDASHTLAEFLSATAARQPTPGGGSVTALAGALGAAIGEMVLNYSVNRKGLEAHADRQKAALARLTRARHVLLELMAEDQTAFDTITCVRKLPADSPERADKHQAALLACIRVPQLMAATAAAVLELCGEVVDGVNRFLLSDLAVCAELSMAAVRCGLYNVKVNVKDVPDAADRAAIEKAAADLLAKATARVRQVVPRIWERDATAK